MGHDHGRISVCVAEHRASPMELYGHHILPTGWGGPNTAANIAWICPTTHANVHELLRAYRKADGAPSWDVRRRFGPYVRRLAADGWERWLERSRSLAI